jgi:hypothetical protein
MLLVNLRLPALPSTLLLLALLTFPISLLGLLPAATPSLKELLGKHVLAVLETDEGAGVFAPVGPEAGREARHVLPHLDRQAGLARLEHYRLVVVDQRGQEGRGLDLDQGTEL